jgi:hypothetical protein
MASEMSRLPHFLNSLFTGYGEVVSLMHQLPFTFAKISGTRFCYRLSRPRVIVRLEGLGQLKNPATSLRIELVTFWLRA